MKKIILLFLMIILLSAVASFAHAYDGEILFRDIPWRTRFGDVLSSLKVIDSYTSTPDMRAVEELNPLHYSYDARCDYTSFKKSLTNIKFQVAGYKVSRIDLYFFAGCSDDQYTTDPYEGTLYRAVYNIDVVNAAATYEDILAKMTAIYGEGNIEHVEDRSSFGSYYMKTCTWNGINNTGVVLYSEEYTPSDPSKAGGGMVSIHYGITNAKEIAQEINKAYRKLMEENENINRKNNANNLEGL